MKNTFYCLLVLAIVLGSKWFFQNGEFRSRHIVFPIVPVHQLGPSKNYVVLNSEALRRTLEGKTAWIIFQSDKACKNQSVILIEETQNPEGDIHPFYVKRAKASIVEAYEEPDVFKSALLTQDISLLFKFQKNKNSLCLAKLNNINIIIGDRFSWIQPPASPFAVALTLKEAIQMKNAVLLDVRSEDEFKQKTLPGAINVPYRPAKKYDVKKTAPLEEIDFLGDRFDWDKKLRLKNQALIVFSSTPSDNRALRALTKLHALNEKNLYWIWSGLLELNDKPVELPESDECCSMIQAYQAAQLIKNGADVVNLTDLMSFNSFHIEGAKLCRNDDPNFNCDQLVSDPNRPVVIYGSNELSIGVLGFAKMLSAKGWKHIYIMRSGFSEWYASHLRNPHLYKIHNGIRYQDPVRNSQAYENK